VIPAAANFLNGFGSGNGLKQAAKFGHVMNLSDFRCPLMIAEAIVIIVVIEGTIRVAELR
jgi:hypothetical protein